MTMFDDYSIKIDYIQGIEEWKCKGETFFFGEFEINDQLQIVDGSWEFFFNTLEPHRKVYKGDYVEGRIFLLSYFDKNFESLLEREKKIHFETVHLYSIVSLVPGGSCARHACGRRGRSAAP